MQKFKKGDIVTVNMISGSQLLGKIEVITERGGRIYYSAWVKDLNCTVENIPQYMVCRVK